MASRADGVQAIDASGVGRVVRMALSDFYFHSGRLVVANVVWGAAVIGLWLVWIAWPLMAFVLAPLLAIPTVGIFQTAARIVRADGRLSYRDDLTAVRDHAGPALLLGVAFLAAGLALGTNAVVGLSQGEPVGWIIGTFAAWGIVVLWCGAIVAWPLLVDPVRADDSLKGRLRLVGLLLLAFPGRFAVLGIVVLLIAVVSTILLAALLTISVAFIALVACRSVYGAADRFEARRGAVAGE